MGNAGIATEFLRMCARGEVRDAYARHVADDFIHHNAWFAGDRESLLLAMEQSAAAEPNKSFEVKQAIAEGDRVAVRLSFRGTQTAPMGRYPATGKVMTVDYLAIYRIENGKIVEAWAEWDNLAGLRQLGHIEDRGH